MTVTRAAELLTSRYNTRGTALFTRCISQPAGALVAACAFRLTLSPNSVTVVGATVALGGSLQLAIARSPSAVVIAAVLLQLAFAFDCADGQLARATNRKSAFGAWLDVACDHFRNCCLALALLYILSRSSLPDWPIYSVTLIYLSGQTVYLHTAASAVIATSPALVSAGYLRWIRESVRLINDTPFVLLMLCVLQPWPLLLAVYCFGLGALSGLRAIGIARSRLAGQ